MVEYRLHRSSSASHLTDVGKCTQIQAKLSQSDQLSVGGGGREDGLLFQEEEEEVWQGSSSLSNLDHYMVFDYITDS